MQRAFLAIDLKSFYASVECIERGLDPLTTHLVVADESRTAKTICLAVSPSLKAHGISGRARLFEVIRQTEQVNRERKARLRGRDFSGKSYRSVELQADPSLELSYIVAPPRMALYVQYSTQIYEIYLQFFAPEDIHVYSIDEVFIDVTHYLRTYNATPRELAVRMLREVQEQTGITATAGIGTNLYLCKIAMDIVAKHTKPDENGVRIGELDELQYRRMLWAHTPITDFWRVGRGIAAKLAQYGMYTMGDVARCSIGRQSDFYNEDLLYKLFGVQAELLIDHAWGWEPCESADIKRYKPQTNSVSSGQVLHCPYTVPQARIIVQEMAEQLALDLLDKRLVTEQITLTVHYESESLRGGYDGAVSVDYYGRKTPRHAHGTAHLNCRTSSMSCIADGFLSLYDRIVDPALLVRRLTLTADRLEDEQNASAPIWDQMDLFTDYAALQKQEAAQAEALEKERHMQQALLDIKKKYGKNAIVKGLNMREGATAMDRNEQIGGHKA